jgi:hypothetical protein
LALILVIIGGVDLSSNSTSEQSKGKTFSKAGVIIFLAVFLFLYSIAVYMITKIRGAPTYEKRILWAVLAAFPFMAVRMAFTIISSFSNLPKFSIRTADPVVQLVMAILEELAVVLLYTAAGLLAPREKDQTAQQVAEDYQNGDRNSHTKESNAMDVEAGRR